MGFFINFYGNSNAILYVNNNGNVTFTSAQSHTYPNWSNLGLQVIAPYWADVDTPNPVSDVVKYGTNGMVDGHNAFGVDWVNVGYFSSTRTNF